MGVFLACMSVQHMCAVPIEVRKCHQIPCGQTYCWLWVCRYEVSGKSWDSHLCPLQMQPMLLLNHVFSSILLFYYNSKSTFDIQLDDWVLIYGMDYWKYLYHMRETGPSLQSLIQTDKEMLSLYQAHGYS